MKPIQILLSTIEKIKGAYAPSTFRAYKTNFEKFILFCEEFEESALPASSNLVAQYIKKLTNSHLKANSIRIAIAAIATIHKLNQMQDPTQLPEVKLELRRMYRTLGRECKQAYGISNITLNNMLSATDKNYVVYEIEHYYL